MRIVAIACLTSVLVIAVPAIASGQSPLPACTEHVIHIDDLPEVLTESVRYEFTVSSDDELDDDVNVTMAVQGQDPYWSGTVDPLGYDASLWIEVDPGDPPLVVTATATSVDPDTYEDCQDTVTQVVTHHPPRVSVLCSDYDGYGNHPLAKFSPRTCVLGQQNWRYHAQGFMSLGKINGWQGWGTSSATARATWYENMGLKAKVHLRLYRLRQVGESLVYTRAKVTHVRWNHKPHTGRSITVKLPTEED
jgi:hypothetical protein